MERDFSARTNEIENLALEAVRNLLMAPSREINPEDICETVHLAYSIQAAREWRAQGGSMLAYRQWQARLDKDGPVVEVVQVAETGVEQDD